MSLADKLTSVRNEIALLDKAITDLLSGVSVLDIANDPALVSCDTTTTTSLPENVTEGLNIYELNSKLKDVEQACDHLNQFWIMKNMFKEIEQALEYVSSDKFLYDQDILVLIVSNLKKLCQKISGLSQSNSAIAAAMKKEYDHFLVDFASVLVHMFHTFAPECSGTVFTINGRLSAGDTTLGFDEFVDVASQFETLYSDRKIIDMLSSLKTHWDTHVLEPLISKRCSLSLSNLESDEQCLQMSYTSSESEFSMDLFLRSLQCFVLFVNATRLQSFKNFFSTKISNGLADIISEHISCFTGDQENLTKMLMQTIELLSSSEWTIPLRNIFVAQTDVRSTLKSLHLNWVTDKYIDEIRSVFSGPSFDRDFKNQKIVQHTVEVQPTVAKTKQEKFQSLKNTSPLSTDNVSEEIEWNDNWGSDDEEPDDSKDDSSHIDGWDENWDEGWSDEDGDHHQERAHKEQQQIPNQRTDSSFETNVQSITATDPPSSHTETHTFVVSAIPERLSQLLAKFNLETEGADPKNLIDSIISMALVSYPPVSQLFLILNDLKSVECSTTYLKEIAETEWSLFCQSFSKDVSEIFLKPSLLEFENESEMESSFHSIGLLRVMLEGLVDSQLRYTNSHKLKLFVIQVLNFTNAIVLQKVLRSEEITEYQSEEFTRFLESLQVTEANVLARFGEQIEVLATSNKIMQTKFLINNHLKSIMEYFYLGELYDFSTEELVSVIKSVFIPSELRENCLDEIIDVRNS